MTTILPNSPVVRIASAEDASSLAVLARALISHERALNEFAGELNPWAASPEELRKQLLRPGTCFFVAEMNIREQHEIIGYLKAVIYGLPPDRREVGLLRWLNDKAERTARRIFDFLMRRPRPSTHLIAGYIAGAFVRPDMRRAGIGQLLVAAAEEWFRTHGVSTSELHVLAANESARQFWTEAGYQPLALGMRKKL